jgi:hypothetical protein
VLLQIASAETEYTVSLCSTPDLLRQKMELNGNVKTKKIIGMWVVFVGIKKTTEQDRLNADFSPNPDTTSRAATNAATNIPEVPAAAGLTALLGTMTGTTGASSSSTEDP